MTEKPKKINRNLVNSQINRETTKKATNREVLEIIVANQQAQGGQLGDLTYKVAKLEQRVDDYICNHEKQENRDERKTVNAQSNVKWVAAFIISTVLGIAGFLWGVLQ